MSNLSDIGFSVKSQDELWVLMEQAFQAGHKIPALEEYGGYYVRLADLSGAELWLQLDREEEWIGMNPHYRGKSRVPVVLHSRVNRPQSDLDGAWVAWVNPLDPADPDTGDYPMVFDSPDFCLHQGHFPRGAEVQLTAFSQEIRVYEDEDAFAAAQIKEEIPFAAQSFIPVGLIGEESEENPDAVALITGRVLEAEEKRNQFSGQVYSWILLESLGITLDLVVDEKAMESLPPSGSVVQCQAWLSGQIVG